MVWSTIFAPAQLVGYVALVLGILAFLQRCDTRLKVLVAAESIAYTVHFFCWATIRPLAVRWSHACVT